MSDHTTTSTIALFPGTFDPITNGHLDVIRRGQHLFDRLVVAVGHNPAKKSLFSLAERKQIVSDLVTDMSHIEVDTYQGLTVDYARRIGATVILRGLRNVTDLHYEFQLALTNRAVADIETVFIMTGEAYGFTSSSLIKQIVAGGGLERLDKLLPPAVIEGLRQKIKDNGGNLSSLRTDDFAD